METTTYEHNFKITAENEYNAKVKIAVIQNLLSNLTDDQFVNTLFAKIKKDKNFFKKVAANPLLKML
ncbi:MAG: hypothetical protein IJ150_01330 [Bacteroidales bacterium]|nr:hypothetical protein [Bacteroidales bacterium]